MIPLSYADQIVEGSFEYALNEIVEQHLDLSVFEHRYHNDATGRSAYDPRACIFAIPTERFSASSRSSNIKKVLRRNVAANAMQQCNAKAGLALVRRVGFSTASLDRAAFLGESVLARSFFLILGRRR